MHAGDILSATQTISDTFLISAQSMIIFKGTIQDDYTIQSRERNSSDTWESDGADAELTSDDNRVVWQGSPELEYRLNLGSGNAGPTASVQPAYSNVWR